MTIANALLMAAAGANRIQPLGNVVPSCVFDLDATIADSYTSGQVWANWEPTPADGSAQSAYDFNRGAGSGSESSDPTFNGTVGSPSAYWSFDGLDFFTKAGTNTEILNNMFKQSSSHNIGWCAAIRLSTVGSTSSMIFSNQSSGRGGTFGKYSTSNDHLGILQVGSGSAVADTNPATLFAGIDYFLAGTWDRATNRATLWINDVVFPDIAFTFVSGTTNAGTSRIGIRGDGADATAFPSGTRLYAVSMFNETLDSAKVAAIRNQYQTRHQRPYA